MTKTNVILVGGASFILGCLVGGGVVFIRAVPPMAEMAEIAALADLSQAGSEAYIRYRYGTYPVAKTALLEYRDRVGNYWGKKVPASREVLGVEFGLTYGRLALAAERTGHGDDAQQYMRLAQEAFSKPGDSVDESR